MSITISILSKLIIGLISLLIVVRLLGKKSLSQMTLYDFVYTLVLGGILEESLYDDQVKIWQLVMGIAFWALLIYILELAATNSDRLNTLFKGEPSVIIYEGKIVVAEMKRNSIELEQLRGLMRVNGCYSLQNAENMILETGGQISLTVYDEEDKYLSIFVIDNGKIQEKVLENHQLEKTWLLKELQEKGHTNLENIIYAEWTQSKGLYIVTRYDLIRERVILDG